MTAVVPPPDGASITSKILYFIDLLEDSAPNKMSWTKFGVMCSTICASITGFATAMQAVAGDIAHTDWQALAGAVGFHTVTKGMHELKRRTETKGE